MRSFVSLSYILACCHLAMSIDLERFERKIRSANVEASGGASYIVLGEKALYEVDSNVVDNEDGSGNREPLSLQSADATWSGDGQSNDVLVPNDFKTGSGDGEGFNMSDNMYGSSFQNNSDNDDSIKIDLYSMLSGGSGEVLKHACVPNPCGRKDSCRVVSMNNQIHICLPGNGSCGPRVCLNNGRCKPIGLSYKCVCEENFEGDHCESKKPSTTTPILATNPIGPCYPSPCKHDCVCEESCKHEHGYNCRSLSGEFTGKNCTSGIPKVLCEQNSVQLQISKSLVSEYDKGLKNSFVVVASKTTMNSRRVINKECIATEWNNEYYVAILTIPSPKCGVKMVRNGADDKLVGQLWLDRNAQGAVDVAVPIANFECTYLRQYDVSTSLSPIIKLPARMNGNASFDVSISLCQISACQNDCPENFEVMKAAMYTVGEVIHVTTQVVTTGKKFPMDMSLATQEVFLSCDVDMTKKEEKLNILSNWCQPGVGMYITQGLSDSVRSCFSFQLPYASCNEVYIFAKVKLCTNPELCPGSAARTCRNDRKRRSINGEGIAIIGPITILESRSVGNVDMLLPDVLKNFKNSTTEDEVAWEIDYLGIAALTVLYILGFSTLFTIAYAVYCKRRKNGTRPKFMTL